MKISKKQIIISKFKTKHKRAQIKRIKRTNSKIKLRAKNKKLKSL